MPAAKFIPTLARARKSLALALAIFCAAVAGTLAAENQVLELDGQGSYVEFSPTIFSNLTSATIEGWVKWDSFRLWSRFFDFGARWNGMVVGNWERSSGVYMHLYVPENADHKVIGSGLLVTNRWFHIAAVSGPGGMKMYLDGVLLGTNPMTNSFSTIQKRRESYLGRSTWVSEGVTASERQDEDFHGQMDEVRVWSTERSEAEIRANMHRRLAGNEPGLVTLWNFENIESGVVKDSGPGGNDGRMMGNARAAAATPPLPEVSSAPERVLDLDGQGYVQLPDDIFTNLTETTVEAHVFWRRASGAAADSQRFFSFGTLYSDMGAGQEGPGRMIYFISRNEQESATLRTAPILQIGRWHHVAAVSGPQGMKLYLNGALIASSPSTWSFPVTSGKRNLIGAYNSWPDGGLHRVKLDGMVDEFRVWNRARTGSEIREWMNKKARGDEPELAGLWNFDDGTARDASPRGNHGVFVGSAKASESEIVTAGSALNILAGKILERNGQPASGAQVSMEMNGISLVTTLTEGDGGYRLITRATNGMVELTATSGEAIARHSLSLSAGEHQIPTLTLEQNSISGAVAALDFSPVHGAIVESLWFGEGASDVAESPEPGASAHIQPGLVGEFFRLSSSPTAIPEMKGRPHATRIDAMLDYQNLTRFAARGVSENFAARWTGKLRVAKAGTYRFYIRADDGGRVFIDGKLVADNRNVWSEEGTGEASLAAGDHELKVEMIQQEGGASCVLFWSGDDFARQPVPAAALWHEISPGLDTMTLAPLNPDAKALLTNSALTDASGEFKLTGLRRGWHQLRVHDGHRFRYLQEDGSKVLRLKANAQLSLPEPSFRLSPAQSGFWRNHTYASGLADNRVFCVLADSKGFVWFGTGDGVSRHDGEKFVNLSKEDGLANNVVLSAYEDRSGAIWFGTQRGVSCYRNGEFEEIAELEALSAEPVRGITEDASGAMWFSTVPNGIFKHQGKKVEHIAVTNGLPQGIIYQVIRGPDGHVWAACNGNVFRHTGSNFVDVFPAGYVGAAVGDIDLARDGSVWLGTTEGLMRYDGTNLLRVGRSRGVALNISIIGAMNVDADGTVWFGTRTAGSSSGAGLSRFDGETFSYFPSVNGLAQGEITGVARDQRGLLWVSTWDNGVWSCDEHGFARYSGRDGLIATNLEICLGAKDGAVWFGGEGAFGRIRNGRVENFNYVPGSMGLFHNALASSNDGTIWVGSRGPNGGVVKFDGTNFNAPQIEGWPTGLGLRGLAASPDGKLWIASMREVSSYDGSRLVKKRAGDFQLTNQNAFAAIHAAGDGSVWVGTSGEGLVRIQGESFSRLAARDGLADDDVTAIASDPDGTMWFGTVNGVSRYDGKSFTNFSQAKGRLAGNSILCIFRDSRGAHWFGTRRGATRLANEAWSTFDARDGIAGNEVRSICEDANGAIWFATEKGLSQYTPRIEKLRALALTVAGDAQPGTEPGQYRLLKGRRLAVQIGANDPLTDGRKRWYQRQMLPGVLSEEQLKARQDWGAPSREAQLEWVPEQSGSFTVAARYMDRDLNYSDPVLAYVTVVPPWYSNPLIAGPSGVAVAGLVGWAFVARTLYMRKRREAERLREKMLEQEHAAREAAERAHAEIETKNAELAAAKVAAEQASQAKSQFLANMSHELRTPLTAIIGFSEMLITEAQAEKREEQVEDLTRINDSANHLLGLINGILDLSKIEAQKMDLHLESFDVPALVREACEMIRSLVERKGNRLEIECPAGVGRMRADLVKVRQCLLNLMGNANKFTEKGTVLLRVERAGALIRFAVNDTGIGMTPQQMENLFQPFTQGDASTARKYGGSGLGLTITKRFCEMMGGTIRAESEAGKGSTFTMELPAEVGAAPADPRGNGHPPVEKNGKQVLVIDDDPNVHRLIEKTLKDEPVSLRFAANAEEGLRLARQIKPAVITLDVMMPQTDGWSVLSSLKADPVLAKIPVVMLTIIGDRELGFALGAADYLVKPIDRNQLLLTLKKHLAGNGGGRVLIVEDDPALREMLRRMLEGEQWAVEEAANGAIALERMRERAPAIILLDLAMPVMDGFQVLAELHKQEQWRRIPVVVITAMDLTQKDRQQLLQHTERIFEKGAHLQQDLVREIRGCLEQYRP